MADRHPIVIHHEDEQLHELNVGDNLDIDGSGIINANSLSIKNGTADQILLGNGTTTSLSALPSDLGDLGDVSAVAPVADSHLEWTGTQWEPVLRSKLVNMLDVDSTNATDGAFLTRSFTDDGFELTNPELSLMGDVDLTGQANGDVLTYNSTSGKYEPSAASGGATVLSDLTDVSSNAPTNNQILKYNGAVWLPVAPNVIGNYDFDYLQTVGAAQDEYVLAYDHASGQIKLVENTGGNGAGGPSLSATEGTWTPVFQYESGDFATTTYTSNRYGTWTRIGNRVFVTARCAISALTYGTVTGANRACVGGFPFTIDSSFNVQTMINGRTSGFSTTVTGMRSKAAYGDRFILCDNASKQDEVAYNQMTSSADIAFTGSYVTSDA